MEIELKLSLPESALDALLRHPALQPPRAQKQTPHHLKSTYFDTDQGSLVQAGFGLRIRDDDGVLVQTLKTAGTPFGAASFREEWEWPLSSAIPDLPLMAPVPGMANLLPLLEKELKPVFATDFTRDIYLIAWDGTIIEAAIDRGRLQCGKAEEPILELELELKAGKAAALYHLALELIRTLKLRIAPVSKAERGYRLLNPGPFETFKTALPDHDPSVDAGEAFQSLIGNGIHHMLANQPATEAGEPEGLHQMRIAVRRLRGILIAFQPWLEPHSAQRFEDMLRCLGRAMGQARDWDVFALDVLPVATGSMPPAWRCGLEECVHKAREKAHAELASVFEGQAFGTLLLSLNAWSAKPDLGDALQTRLSDLAPSMLDRLARKVHKHGKQAFSGSDQELHKLRKSLKKLRYSIDDVRFLFSDKQIKACLKPCKILQAALGDFNDAAVANGLAAQLADDGRVDFLPVLHPIWDWAAQRKQNALRHAKAAWQDFNAVEAFW